MKQREITLCSKPVTLGYCYATEIGYKILADEDINDFFTEAAEALNKKQLPDIRKTIYLILAAMTAYYDSRDEQSPLTDRQLMTDLTPQEIGTALGTVIVLRNDFYAVPTDEPQDKETTDGDRQKNV